MSKKLLWKKKILGYSAGKGQINTIRGLAEFISLPKTCLGTSTANKLKLVQINNHLPSTPSWGHKKQPQEYKSPWQCTRIQQQTMVSLPKHFSLCAEKARSSKMGSLQLHSNTLLQISKFHQRYNNNNNKREIFSSLRGFPWKLKMFSIFLD